MLYGQTAGEPEVQLSEDDSIAVLLTSGTTGFPKGCLATHGYYESPDATTVSFRDGWFYTGDLGYFDEVGHLFVFGRKKDMVKSGGISIYPLEIESVIYSHPDILEAAVIGVPDPQWGEALKAVIVLKPGGKLDGVELVNFCKEVGGLPRVEVGGFRRVVATYGSGQGEQGPGSRDDVAAVI